MFLQKRFPLLLLIFVLISYGQLLFMQPWQEDNVIFFKLAHIEERAGYLGKTMWGSGTYRFIITPYYLLYKIFGYKIPVYYALAFFAFFLASLSIYFLFKKILNKRAGIIASLLFAAGYYGYDGFVRIYNSTSASIGIILLSILLINYWKYFKTRRIIFYICALVSYFLIIQLSYIRVHYLIVPIIFFDLLFFSIPFNFKKLLRSTVRLIPFIFLFYKYYILEGDSRTASTVALAKSILNGKVENTFSFFSTLGNLVLPDKIQGLFINTQIQGIEIITLILFLSFIFFITRKTKFNILFTIASAIISIIWLFLSNNTFSNPNLIYGSPQSIFASFVGGLLIITMFSLILKFKESKRKLILVFCIAILANIAAYASYTPTTPYGTGYRYIAHSWVAFIGILMVISSSILQKRKIANYMYGAWIIVILFLGVTNLNSIVNDKSIKIKTFYSEMQSGIKKFPVGSIIYFDIKDNPEARSFYAVSFSVAEMPDTTAIAWRYGIDRYDIEMFTNYDDFIKEVTKTKTPLEKVYTFWITENGLINTTDNFRSLQINKKENLTNYNLTSISKPNIKSSEKRTEISQDDLILNLKKPLTSILPLNVSLNIKASPLDINDLNLPINFDEKIQNPIYQNDSLITSAFEYQKEKMLFLKNSIYTASSEWQERVIGNINDNDPDTVWQGDRIEWNKNKAYIKIDLKHIYNLSGIAWINGFPNNTPTKYSVEVSLNNKDWTTVSNPSNLPKINTKDIQTDWFKTVDARYIKINFQETLSDDSVAIGELWPITSKFSNTDIKSIEDFLNAPFNTILNKISFMDHLKSLSYMGKAKFYWKGDESNSWQTTNASTLNIVYDNKTRQYNITIPQSGTEIDEIKISNFTIPGTVIINSLNSSNITVE